MRNPAKPPTGLVLAAVLVLLATASAAPAEAQIGRLKKKVKAAAGVKATPAAPADGGTIVLDDEVLTRLLAGLRAGRAEREKAAKSDSPYGRHLKAQAAYASAKPRCAAAQQAFYQRAAGDIKLAEMNAAYLEKMVAAQQKGDTAAQQQWADSMAALIDPSCTVKEPRQPSDWYDQQRAVDVRGEEEELRTSGFDRNELGAVKDRVIAILQDAPPPDVSPSEKDAVDKHSVELNDLMGRGPPPAAATAPPPPPAAAPPPPAPAGPTLTADQQAMSACMAKNAEKHEQEVERLGRRAADAAESGNTAAAMVISDSIRQLQMAGCE